MQATARDPFSLNPEATTRVVHETSPRRGPAATEKQISFIRTLAEEAGRVSQMEDQISRGVTKRQASELIEGLKERIRDQRASAPVKATQEAPEGIHFYGNEVIKVQVAVHGSGKKYAKVLNMNSGAWEYVGRGPLRHLSSDTLMTLEQAKEFGHLYGMCCRCGATLTDEGSIAAGIGPVCATKF